MPLWYIRQLDITGLQFTQTHGEKKARQMCSYPKAALLTFKKTIGKYN